MRRRSLRTGARAAFAGRDSLLELTRLIHRNEERTRGHDRDVVREPPETVETIHHVTTERLKRSRTV
jgi:hypothetical protein